MARCSLIVLKVPLNASQPTNQSWIPHVSEHQPRCLATMWWSVAVWCT